MSKYLKDPLLVFLLLGGALFLLFQLVDKNSEQDNTEIVVSAGQILALQSNFKKIRQRLPSKMELDTIINLYVREEILYREALTLGLDKNDTIIKRRLSQKIEFLSEDLANLDEPEAKELETYFATHSEKYRQSSRIDFRQVFFDISKRGKQAHSDAKAILTKLQIEDADITELGDGMMIPQHFRNETEIDIERALGSEFADALRKLPKGNWTGPIVSGFGLHLVRIDNWVEGKLPELEQVKKLVMRDWASEKRKHVNAEFYQGLRKKYVVTIEAVTGDNMKTLFQTKATQ